MGKEWMKACARQGANLRRTASCGNGEQSSLARAFAANYRANFGLGTLRLLGGKLGNDTSHVVRAEWLLDHRPTARRNEFA